jgi:hypothetical protein
MEEKKKFCTTIDNIEERCHEEGFDIAILPRSFQDAINVTRKLGKQYLWIDSLCIIQYGDHLEDWKRESKKMVGVFRNAYCTIAATSATDANQGFLARPSLKDTDSQTVHVKESLHGPLYVSRVVDDFQSDVEAGILNQRGWVFQERALSRRTVHFTANQAYWECGDGVRCETLTRMRK